MIFLEKRLPCICLFSKTENRYFLNLRRNETALMSAFMV